MESGGTESGGVAVRAVLLLAWVAVVSAQSVRILEPPDGAILNRSDGRIEGGKLWTPVHGETRSERVFVNGIEAKVEGGRFEAVVPLADAETRLIAKDVSGVHSITVLRDRNSYPRYRVSVDDNILFLADLARNAGTYQSIFDNPYMAFWREMHRKYGAKIHFNIYYETPGFNLSQMPLVYRAEWQANRGWIRLTFHARADQPARPYLDAPAEKVIADYRLVTREIERFAGKELLSPVTTIHWGEATREACRALRAEGIRVLVGYFELDKSGAPRVSYYLDRDRTSYLSGRDYWKDNALDLFFIRHDMVINNVDLAQIEPRLEKLAADPHQSQLLELMIHEQYWHPSFPAYKPDYRERVERAIAWAARRNYRPVFWSDGFLGAK
jgi:hypothetical protein